MATKKVNNTPIEGLEKHLTAKELDYANHLWEVYVKELAADANLDSTLLRRFNYQGLWEYGIHTPDHIISVLIKLKHPYANHLIVAHGYITAKF